MLNIFKFIKDFFRRFIFATFHKVGFKLRYEISVKDIKVLDQPKPTDPQGGWMILPAHPSHLDGIMLVTELVKHGLYVHVWTSEVVKNFSYFKWCRKQRDIFDFVWIPAAEDKKTDEDAQRIHKILVRTVDGLKKGENYVIFPAAHPKFFPKNFMKGKSAVSNILKLYPNVNIVFVRIKGLWGSRFSRASKREDKHKHPASLGEHLSTVLRKFIRSLFANLLFFMPRRKVEIEFIPAPKDFPRQGSRIAINRYIEHLFNEGWGIEGEPVYRVPEYFWKNEYVDNEYEETRYNFDLDEAPGQIRENMMKLLYERSSLKPHQMDYDMSLGRDLGLDSLDLHVILTVLERDYGVTHVSPNELTTVGHVIALAAKLPITETKVKKKFYKIITQEAPLPLLWKQLKKSFGLK